MCEPSTSPSHVQRPLNCLLLTTGSSRVAIPFVSLSCSRFKLSCSLNGWRTRTRDKYIKSQCCELSKYKEEKDAESSVFSVQLPLKHTCWDHKQFKWQWERELASCSPALQTTWNSRRLPRTLHGEVTRSCCRGRCLQSVSELQKGEGSHQAAASEFKTKPC